MADDAVELFRMLVEAGAQPGEDFSYDMQSRSAQISDLAFEKLKAAYPHVDWQSICERVEVDPALPVEYLNTYLGIDFVGRMIARIEQRLEELEDPQATWYLQQVLGGVEQRTNVPFVRTATKTATANQAGPTRAAAQADICALLRVDE